MPVVWTPQAGRRLAWLEAGRTELRRHQSHQSRQEISLFFCDFSQPSARPLGALRGVQVPLARLLTSLGSPRAEPRSAGPRATRVGVELPRCSVARGVGAWNQWTSPARRAARRAERMLYTAITSCLLHQPPKTRGISFLASFRSSRDVLARSRDPPPPSSPREASGNGEVCRLY